MQVAINQGILEQFGHVTIGVAMFTMDVFSEDLGAYCSLNQSKMKEHYSTADFENIDYVKKWNGIFNAMNAKKSKESSVVFLTRYLLEHDSLFHVHPIVDLYNTISVKFGLPMGAYDANKLVGRVELRRATKGEEFTGINAKHIEKTHTDEVVYSDAAGVFCRYWNDKDSERTKITGETKEFVIILDGIDDYEKIQNAIMELRNVLEDAKNFRHGILHRQSPQLNL